MQYTSLVGGLSLGVLVTAATASAAEPSFDCTKVGPQSTEAIVCSDPELAELDVQLLQTYSAALGKVGNGRKKLTAEQRGWIKGQHDCWKADDKRACLKNGYQYRRAELQTRYRLIKPIGSATYVCDGGETIRASYYPTEPASALVVRGKETVFMTVQPAASGARYSGGNASVWEHQGEAAIRWSLDGPERLCRKTGP
jgi:uncharacterized protein